MKFQVRACALVLLMMLFLFADSCNKGSVVPVSSTDDGKSNPSTNKPATSTTTGSGATSTTTSGSTTATPVTSASPINYTPSGVISLDGSHDITISGKSINGGPVPAISLSNCYNVHITQNKLGNSTDVGIKLFNCKNITIDYNYITNVSGGVYVVQSSQGGIIVNNNQFLNMNGPSPRGQFVQFDNVSGPNNSISYNKGENISGQSNPQDAINLFMSNGTAASPIQVTGNWIRGGGPSTTGSGIMLGDYGGSYEVASNNILVDPGQCGMAIAGGDHMSIINNSIYARAQSFTNVGIYVWGQAGYAITNSTVSGNNVKFISQQYGENDSWLASGTPIPTGWNTNIFGANITSSILPSVIITL